MCLSIVKLLDRHAKLTTAQRTKVYRGLIRLFEDQDCDTLYEVADKHPEFRKVLG